MILSLRGMGKRRGRLELILHTVPVLSLSRSLIQMTRVVSRGGLYVAVKTVLVLASLSLSLLQLDRVLAYPTAGLAGYDTICWIQSASALLLIISVYTACEISDTRYLPTYLPDKDSKESNGSQTG